jgi:hypothetical protein
VYSLLRSTGCVKKLSVSREFFTNICILLVLYHAQVHASFSSFLGVGVRLRSLSTSATHWPIVPAPNDMLMNVEQSMEW